MSLVAVNVGAPSAPWNASTPPPQAATAVATTTEFVPALENTDGMAAGALFNTAGNDVLNTSGPPPVDSSSTGKVSPGAMPPPHASAEDTWAGLPGAEDPPATIARLLAQISAWKDVAGGRSIMHTWQEEACAAAHAVATGVLAALRIVAALLLLGVGVYGDTLASTDILLGINMATGGVYILAEAVNSFVASQNYTTRAATHATASSDWLSFGQACASTLNTYVAGHTLGHMAHLEAQRNALEATYTRLEKMSQPLLGAAVTARYRVAFGGTPGLELPPECRLPLHEPQAPSALGCRHGAPPSLPTPLLHGPAILAAAGGRPHLWL